MPEQWSVVPAGRVARIEIGGTPAREVPKYWAAEDTGNPWASIADLSAPIVERTAEYISDLGAASSNVKLVPAGTPIMSFKLTIGRTSRAGTDLYTNEAIAAFFVDERRLDSRFLYQVLPGAAAAVVTDVAIKGATLNKRSLNSMLLPLPPIDEQRRIAQILDTLDEEIEASAQTHAKLHATFRGLLVELMTSGTRPEDLEGIGSDGWPGKPRTGWTIEPLSNLLGSADPAMRSGPFGSALLKHELVESGVPLLGIDNVHVDRFSAAFNRYVTPAKAAELARYLVRPNDVMITIMGTVGRSCVVPENIGSALSSKHVWTLTLDEARYRPYLASLQLNHAPWARAHLRKDEQGGIMSAIRSETLKSLMLPVPPIEEQREIEAVLRSLESKIAAEAGSLTKLRLLKAGLADDLLTGRVRVSPELVS